MLVSKRKEHRTQDLTYTETLKNRSNVMITVIVNHALKLCRLLIRFRANKSAKEPLLKSKMNMVEDERNWPLVGRYMEEGKSRVGRSRAENGWEGGKRHTWKDI